jgi:tRNA A37 threonylcarbamoyladenosine synthetase subunit TsaC/SUA5/YrdC
MDLTLLNALSNLEKPDGVVAIPGPDGYMLASRLDHPQALSRIHRMTGRDEGMLLIGRDIDAFLPYLAAVPLEAFELMKQHWPGLLIILLHKNSQLPELITPQSHVKVMQPDNPLLLDLLSLNPGGLLATSCASRDGEPPALGAEDVFNTFGDDVDYVLQNDESVREGGAPTVISVDPEGTIHLLRSGRIVLD